METRNIKIDITTAQRWAEGTDKELKELALQTFPELAKKQLPKKWEDLKEIQGYYVTQNSKISTPLSNLVLIEKHNIFATHNQAKSAIAMAKLSQLIAVYNGDWVADWKNLNQNKYCIVSDGKCLSIFKYLMIKEFLAFKDMETAEEFLNNFRDDIETYFNY